MPQPTRLLKRLRYRGEAFVLRSVAAGIPRLSRRTLHRLADALGFVAAHLDRRGRRVALSNIRLVFPEMPVREQRALVRRSYQYFARGQADLFWSPRLTRETVRDFFELTELDRFWREHSKEQAFLFVGPHYGGYEWFPHLLGLLDVKCAAATQAFKNELIEPIFAGVRELSGHLTIRREGALVRLLKALKNGRSVILAVDLTIPPQHASVPVRCFGMLTSMTFGHAFLHQRSGAPLIPTVCEPMPDGRYKVRFFPPLEFGPEATHREIVQACWDAVEPLVRRNPAPWLWMYKYWRYRPLGATERYPDYANESTWFEVRLARAAEEQARRRAPSEAPAG